MGLTVQLAAIAHGLWCARMRAEGWRRGRRYDAARRTHDALVPYERLGPQDRRAARIGIEACGVESRLAEAIEYPRGPDRPLSLREMRIGCEVVFCREGPPRSRHAVPAPDIGRIVGWTVDARGTLHLIRVRWPGGEVARYTPWERALARLDELPSPPRSIRQGPRVLGRRAASARS